MSGDVLELADRLWRGEVCDRRLPPGRPPRRPRRDRRRRGLRPLVRERLGLRDRRTASCSSTRAAPSSPRRSTTSSGAGPASGCTPRCTRTATSTTSSACPCGTQSRPSAAGRQPVVIAHEALPARFDRYRHDGRLQRGDQPAPVRRARTALADRVPLPGPHLPRPVAFRGRRDRRSSCGTRRARPTTTP